MAEFNLKEAAIQLYERAASYLDIPPRIYLSLLEPERVLYARLPVRMDNGEYMIFDAWRSQHCSWLPGPTKGGIRYHSRVTRDEVVGLSMFMTWKCGLMNLPYGGAKGGANVAWDVLEKKIRKMHKKGEPEEIISSDIKAAKSIWREKFPKGMSKGERKRLTDEYVEKMFPIIGIDKDVPAPDVNTDEETMGWFMNRYSAMVGHTVSGVVTGKPLSIGGSVGRSEATGRGCFYTIKCALQHLGISPEKATVAVQGYGNAGVPVAMLLHKEGVKVRAVSDSKGAILNENGLDPKKVLDHKNKNGSVVGFPEADTCTNEELLTSPVTILVPAALEGVITAQNAAHIRARIIAEAANGPTAPEADSILNENGVFICPDILANGGGVVVSYFEWVQDLQSFFWGIEEVNKKLERVMTDAFNLVVETSKQYNVPMRTAAFITAIKRVVQCGIDRGKAL